MKFTMSWKLWLEYVSKQKSLSSNKLHEVKKRERDKVWLNLWVKTDLGEISTNECVHLFHSDSNTVRVKQKRESGIWTLPEYLVILRKHWFT